MHSELPEVVQSEGGSANLFPLLGVTPAFGRLFTEAEDKPKGEPVVLLTWSLFQRRFAGDPSIIGKQIHLDTIPTTVVGVLPNWFTYPDARVQYWVPYAQPRKAGRTTKATTKPAPNPRVYAWRNLSKFAKTLQKGQLISLEGTLRYREVEIEGKTLKHRISEIRAITMKRLSKIETADDPADGAGDE